MDNNHLYQDQQPGTEPDNQQDAYQSGGAYQSNDVYQQGTAYQSNDVYQQGTAYQSNDAYQQGNTYQQTGYGQYDQNGAYGSGNYQNGSYNNANYYNGTYSGGNYGGGNYNNGSYGNYNSGYGNGNYQTPYQQSQLDLEEPVKMSEWFISLLLMMVPCVNIVMMFVWAFSKTEKKSKSNLFKVLLIAWGFCFLLYFIIIILFAAGIFGSMYY